MNIDAIREYCLSKNGVTEDMPFGENVLVFRIGGKIFLLTDIEAEITSVNLKCDPNLALELRDRYPTIKPGYHMNKKHWNTVVCDDTISRSLLHELIDHSFDLVFRSLPYKMRKELL